jgi:predicted Rossmann fold nucleotide-binding protein DprA/Smf involved in DNA uptake
MKTNSLEELQNQIERLVRDHLGAQRSAATAAVERAFASTTTHRAEPQVRLASGRRRKQSEMSDMADRLYAAVRAKPGETINVIAAELGETAKALHRPMVHLKKAGRVRSAGQRHLTRYFPMSHSARAS